MKRPAVSVIVPVFNRPVAVRRAIDSVLAQTFSEWELIVVDDGSTDDTAAVVASYGDKVKLLRQSSAGPYAARNAALASARGEFVAFLDSDDAWYPRKLERQLPLFSTASVGLVYGDLDLVAEGREGARPAGRYFDKRPPARGAVLPWFAWGNFVANSTAVVRRSCFDRVGPFSLAGLRGADNAKWIEVALYADFDYVPEPLGLYTIHPGNFGSARVARLRDVLTMLEEIAARHELREGPRAALRRIHYYTRVRYALAAVGGGHWPLWPAAAGRIGSPGLARRVAWFAAAAAYFIGRAFR